MTLDQVYAAKAKADQLAQALSDIGQALVYVQEEYKQAVLEYARVATAYTKQELGIK